MGLDLLIQGTVDSMSGESLFLTEGLCSGEVLGPAARSSGGASVVETFLCTSQLNRPS